VSQTVHGSTAIIELAPDWAPSPRPRPPLRGGGGEFDPAATCLLLFSLPHAVCGGGSGRGAAHPSRAIPPEPLPTPSLHHSITPSLHHSITPSLHHPFTRSPPPPRPAQNLPPARQFPLAPQGEHLPGMACRLHPVGPLCPRRSAPVFTARARALAESRIRLNSVPSARPFAGRTTPPFACRRRRPSGGRRLPAYPSLHHAGA
jgi:hypothetical protein